MVSYRLYHIEYFYCCKNLLWSTYLFLYHPQALANTDLFTVSVVLLYSEFHVIGVTQYVAFSDWHLSLNTMHLKFFHVFSWLPSSFLVVNTIPLSDIQQFIHSPADRYLGCSQLLVIKLEYKVYVDKFHS